MVRDLTARRKMLAAFASGHRTRGPYELGVGITFLGHDGLELVT